MLRAIFYCVMTAAAGYLCVDRLLPPAKAGIPQFLFKASLGTGVGFGLTSCVAFLFLFIVGPSAIMTVAADTALVAWLLTLFFFRNKGSAGAAAAAVPAGYNATAHTNRILFWTFIVVFCASCYLFIVIAATLPHGYSDAWGIWNLRARYLFRGEENWAAVFSPLIRHAGYPYLVSASVLRGWLYAGQETHVVPGALAFLFTFAIPGLLLSALALVRTVNQGVIASLLLLGMPYFIKQGAGQYADTPLAFFILATFIVYYLYESFGFNKRLIILAGICTGLACWTKNEGLLFLVAFVAARCVTVACTRFRRHFFKEAAYLGLGLVFFVMVLAVLKTQTPLDGLIYGGCKKILQQPERLLDSEQYWFIGKSFLKYGLFFHDFIITPVPVLLVYLLLLGGEVRTKDKSFFATTVLCLVLVITGYFFIYLITPYNLDWHIRTSINRLLLHLWPAFLFVFFLVVKTPDQRRQEVIKDKLADGGE